MTAYVPRVYDASASYDQFVHRARARRAQAPRANRYPGPVIVALAGVALFAVMTCVIRRWVTAAAELDA